VEEETDLNQASVGRNAVSNAKHNHIAGNCSTNDKNAHSTVEKEREEKRREEKRREEKRREEKRREEKRREQNRTEENRTEEKRRVR
jgi:hypothetical protein